MTRSSLKALTAVVAGVALFASGRSILAQAVAPIGNSVAVSVHNLNNVYGANTIHDNYGSSQVCLPCHTPHQMPAQNITDNLGKLWNHTLKPASSYVLYNGTTSSTSYLSTIDEVSRKCLGCHDGTIAVDSYGPNPSATVTGTMASNPLTTGFVIGASNNLQHDHPIDVLYNGASNYTGVSTAPTGTNSAYTYSTTWASSNRNNDPGSFTISGYTSLKWGPQPYTVTALSAIGFYKPTGSNQSVTVKDANSAKAANDTSAPTQNADGTYTHTISVSSQYVYCRSCHDPHNNLYHFMRVPNDNSQVCLTCHNK
jgi:predicted CXXCH cytochrome family protein